MTYHRHKPPAREPLGSLGADVVLGHYLSGVLPDDTPWLLFCIPPGHDPLLVSHGDLSQLPALLRGLADHLEQDHPETARRN